MLKIPNGFIGKSPAEWELWPGERAGIQFDRQYGSAVILHNNVAGGRDRVLVFGGSYNTDTTPPFPPTQATWIVHDSVEEFLPGTDAYNPNPGGTQKWNVRTPMKSKRVYCNGVILPTGQILIVGGDKVRAGFNDPEFQPELYNPGRDNTFTGESTYMVQSTPVVPTGGGTPVSTPRLYHHVACLLPDGRVFVAGGQEPRQPLLYPDPEFTGEVFSPPYISELGTRPVIVSTVGSPQSFSVPGNAVVFQMQVRVLDGADIDRVVLIRPAAVTHHFDNDQRYIELDFSVMAYSDPVVTLSVTSPFADLGPAGYYMLFAVEHRTGGVRVPTTAQFVEFQ